MGTKRNGQSHTGGGYKYVHSFIDNRGKRRWRFYRRGYPSKYLPSPDSAVFIPEYTVALAAEPKQFRRNPNSFDSAIDRYLSSASYTGQSGYERRLAALAKDYGQYSITTLTRPHVMAILSRYKGSERNRTLSLIKLVLQESVDGDIIPANVARDIKRVKVQTKSYKTWVRDDIERYLQYYKDDKMARLAILLLYYTGQRGSDIWNIGDESYKEGRIHLTQQKTRAPIDIPVHIALKAEIPHGSGIWLRTSAGNPFGSVKSFQQWFVKKARAAGIIDKSAHGLRRALAAHMAEAGATPSEIGAVTGHKTLTETAKYSADANRARMADEAFRKLN